ncbi:hypothetical protein U0070_012815 [Myodes glareolus]|uniref:Uncharacterized protein n=1 Tax=Myodes glareolus TaxID=447135 RepID=A0AAW0HHS9_MYOGA
MGQDAEVMRRGSGEGGYHLQEVSKDKPSLVNLLCRNLLVPSTKLKRDGRSTPQNARGTHTARGLFSLVSAWSAAMPRLLWTQGLYLKGLAPAVMVVDEIRIEDQGKIPQSLVNRRVGRRPVLLFSIIFILIFGLTVALSVNVTMFSTLRFFEGFCLAGIILTLFALLRWDPEP